MIDGGMTESIAGVFHLLAKGGTCLLKMSECVCKCTCRGTMEREYVQIFNYVYDHKDQMSSQGTCSSLFLIDSSCSLENIWCPVNVTLQPPQSEILRSDTQTGHTHTVAHTRSSLLHYRPSKAFLYLNRAS